MESSTAPTILDDIINEDYSVHKSASTSDLTLGTDPLANQADKGQFSKSRQDQHASSIVQPQPPFLDPALSRHYDATNAHPTTTARNQCRFGSSPADTTLSAHTHYVPYLLPPCFPTSALRKTLGPQEDQCHSSLAAASSSSARTRYAPYALPPAHYTTSPPSKTAFPLGGSRFTSSVTAVSLSARARFPPYAFPAACYPALPPGKTAVPQSEGHSSSSVAAFSLLTPDLYVLSTLYPTRYSTPPRCKTTVPQGDGHFDSLPATLSLPPSPPPPSPLAPEPTTVGTHCAPVREPSAWRLNYILGTGACGTVFLENVHMPGMKSPELWAVKRIPRALPNFTFKRFQAEINNLQALAIYEWFIKFHSTYQDTHYMYIAMEYIPMGDMSQSFADGYRWNEGDTKVVIKQLLHGLAVMHKAGITHRDLKPENIFLHLPENQTPVLRVKIGDFGTSKRIPPTNASTYLKTTTGTQGYMAPEVHDTSKLKTNRVDIWSLGCILYRMFAGTLLFIDSFEVLKYSWTAPSSPLALDDIGFSIPCVSFLRDILRPNPKDRPSAEDCLKKAWIMSEAPELEYSIGNDLYTRLANISHRSPNVDSLPDIVANRAVESSSVS